MKKKTRDRILHDTFRVSILFKGLDGVLEIIGGLLLALLSSSYIAQTVELIFSHELTQDPSDFIANYLVHVTGTLSVGSQAFAAAYLLVHGVVKVGIVTSLWLDKIKAYPIAGGILVLFTMYQIFRLFMQFSVVLLILTLVDIVIIALLKSEYDRIRK